MRKFDIVHMIRKWIFRKYILELKRLHNQIEELVLSDNKPIRKFKDITGIHNICYCNECECLVYDFQYMYDNNSCMFCVMDEG